jgi:uncharacterized protein (TIGR03118 family)
MKNYRIWNSGAAFCAVLIMATGLAHAQSTNKSSKKKPTNDFNWRNYQSDIAGVARYVDPNVINPWGMALSGSTILVADNGTGVITAYNADGTVLNTAAGTPQIINVPKSATNTGTANPTGIETNTTAFFKVTKGATSQPSTLLIVSEDGSISGFNQTLDANNAIIAVDNGATGAVYKGATTGISATKNILYVTNFNSGKVEMYSETFTRVDTATTFADAQIPTGFAPFGIRNQNGEIFVSYAKQNASKHDDVPGAGNGFIDVYDQAGTLLRRLVKNAELNSPWGMERVNVAVGGKFAHGGLFVGNFGDGTINVYDPATGVLLGTPKQSDINHTQLVFDGLWDLLFFNNQFYFTAGIGGEQHGLWGIIFPGL